MQEEQYKKLEQAGKIEDATPKSAPLPQPLPQQVDLSEFITVLNQIKVVKRHVTTAPTYVPRNFWEQFALYDTGGVYRLYVYVNGTWRYVALT